MSIRSFFQNMTVGEGLWYNKDTTPYVSGALCFLEQPRNFRQLHIIGKAPLSYGFVPSCGVVTRGK